MIVVVYILVGLGTAVGFVAVYLYARRSAKRIAANGNKRVVARECIRTIEKNEEAFGSVQQAAEKIRTGSSTVLAVFVFAAVGAAFVAGYSTRERSVIHHAETLKALPVGNKEEPNRSGSPHGQFDSKLAELRTDSRAAAYFKYCSIDPARRAEVIEALQVVACSDNPHHAIDAQCAILRWEN